MGCLSLSGMNIDAMVLFIVKSCGVMRPKQTVCDCLKKTGVYKLIAKSHPWPLSAIAIAALLGLWGTQAAALSLGRISVQSALGEPLKAEIDILDINAEEAATLTAKIATPETFKAAGLDYHAAMGNLQSSLQRRPNGRAFIRLSSDRTINDPFIDLILEANWGSGRIVRDYTLLFDPPNLRETSTAVTTLGQLPAPTLSPPAPTRQGAVPPPATRDVPTATTKPAGTATTTSKPTRPMEGPTVTVKTGDTAGRIAATHKPASVSLDQMLVALMRANPDAFIRDNVNRIKTGSVLALPTEEQAASVSTEQASQMIIAQSHDFNDFRRKFAGSAPAAAVESAGRDVSGKVQATVQDKKTAAATTTDKLTLSKGEVQSKTGEAQLAQAKSAREAASRAAELTKNINDLSKLAAASGTPGAASASPAASKAGLATVAAAVPAVSAPAPVPSAPPAAASAPATTASVTASAAAKVAVSTPQKSASRPVAAPAPPPPEPGFLDDLLENPLVPAGAAALLALLAGLGIYKVRQRKKASHVDSSFIDRSESFLGASGGQNVDTNDNLTTGSSMVYSPSQLDAVDEVDPVAEADVYLAYGRDLQAEEILKDALRNNPQRLAIHHKLLEIYAKRRDAKAFEAIATQAFNLTDGTGSDWEQICENGLTIDPDNALYLPGGQPFAKPSPLTGPAPLDAPSGPPTVAMAPYDGSTTKPAGGASVDLDLDLDLDFSSDDPVPKEPPAPQTVTPAAEPLPSISMNMLDLPPELPAEPAAEPEPEPEPASTADTFGNSLDFSLPEPAAKASPDSGVTAAPPPAAPEKSAAPAAPDLMEFDLGSLSLDLGDEPVTVAGSLAPEGQDPLETKLALADEFRAIGDDDGARALIEEVIAESTGDMKAKAQLALSRL